MAKPIGHQKQAKTRFTRGLTLEMIRIKSALSAPPVRTLRDMSELEICELENHYGCAIIRPTMAEAI